MSILDKYMFLPDNFPYDDLKKLGYNKDDNILRRDKIKNIYMDKLKSGKWKRNGKKTYCGQFILEGLQEFGCDIKNVLVKNNIYLTNTTTTYYNCIKYGVYEIVNSMGKPDPEMAFYIARYGVPVDVLSPSNMVVDNKPYNHSLLVWPTSYIHYSELIGYLMIQEGWKGFYGYVNDSFAYGDNWKNEKIKYFVFPWKGHI